LESTADSICPICGGTSWIFGEATENGRTYTTARECDCQNAAKTEKMLRKSGVDYAKYAEMTLENFMTDSPETAAMKAMAEKFVDDPDALGMGIFGRSGTGKTHICIAACQEITKRRMVPHVYFAYRTEIRALKALIFDEDEYDKRMYRFQNAKILYIDDLFKHALSSPDERRPPKAQVQEMQIVYEIVNARYLNRRTTLFSSELSLKEIATLDEATGSRIYEMCKPYVMKTGGPNRRAR
jgi:DNA replication protein DnaC